MKNLFLTAALAFALAAGSSPAAHAQSTAPEKTEAGGFTDFATNLWGSLWGSDGGSTTKTPIAAPGSWYTGSPWW